MYRRPRWRAGSSSSRRRAGTRTGSGSPTSTATGSSRLARTAPTCGPRPTCRSSRRGLGWLPDGRLLVVSMRDRRVLRREPDGTLVVHADLSGHATGHANDMVLDGAGRAYVGNFGFDLMSGAPLETAVAVPGGPGRHRDRGGRRPVVPQRQRDHPGRRSHRERDVRQPLHRLRPDAGRHWSTAASGPNSARCRPTARWTSLRPSSRSRPTAAASTPRGRCGSPTPPAAACSGSGRAARSPTNFTRAPGVRLRAWRRRRADPLRLRGPGLLRGRAAWPPTKPAHRDPGGRARRLSAQPEETGAAVQPESSERTRAVGSGHRRHGC